MKEQKQSQVTLGCGRGTTQIKPFRRKAAFFSRLTASVGDVSKDGTSMLTVRELALTSVFGICLSYFPIHSTEDELERGHHSSGEAVAILMINDKAVRASSGNRDIEEDMKNIWKTKEQDW